MMIPPDSSPLRPLHPKIHQGASTTPDFALWVTILLSGYGPVVMWLYWAPNVRYIRLGGEPFCGASHTVVYQAKQFNQFFSNKTNTICLQNKKRPWLRFTMVGGGG